MKYAVSTKIWWGSVVLTLLLTVILALIDQPLHTDAAPLGIVSFELAGNQVNAQAIINSWAGTPLIYAGFSLGIDYLYLLSYSASLALTCILLAVRQTEKWRKIGLMVATLMPFAALCDAIENFCLWQMLVDRAAQELAAIAFLAASFKFASIIGAFIYIICSVVLKRQQMRA